MVLILYRLFLDFYNHDIFLFIDHIHLFIDHLFLFPDHAGHGTEMMKTINRKEYYGVVIVSGDGLIYEVYPS